MAPQELSYYQTLITAIASIFGVLIGVLVTTIVNWKIKTKEVKLRVIEKIFDKRILAHEEVLRISKILRITNLTYKKDKQNNAITFPAFMFDRKSVDNLITNFHMIVNNNSHWLDIEIFREINFIQDYIANLDGYLKKYEEKDYPSIGIKIKSDIIDLASSLEKLILNFFKTDIYNINLKVTEGHHKFKKEKTIERFNCTQLSKLISESA